MHRDIPEIEHAERLTAIFGHWPDFHDAELRALRLDAAGPDGPVLETDIEIAEMSSDLDERGYYRDRARCRATLRFRNASGVALGEFRAQNVLDELVVRRLTPADAERLAFPWRSGLLQGEFIPIPGFCTVRLLCDAVVVVRAEALRAAT
jgi:hypothetical protein